MVYSVQDNFDKLLTGVEDVRDSIDCTLLTMERVLDNEQLITYRKVCKNESPPDPLNYPQPQIDYYTPPPLPDTALTYEIMQGKQLTDDVLNINIANTKMDINNTIYDFLNRRSNMGHYEETISAPNTIHNENIELRDIDNVSGIVRQELGKMEQTQINEPIPILLKEFQLLHNEMKINTNATNEIYNILTNLHQELNKTHTLTNSTEWNKLQQSIFRVEQDNNNTYDNTEGHLKEWEILESRRFDEFKALLDNHLSSMGNTTSVKGRSLELIFDKNDTYHLVSNQAQYENETITTTIAAKNLTNNTFKNVALTSESPKVSTQHPISSLKIETNNPKISNTPSNITLTPNNVINSSYYKNILSEPTFASSVADIKYESSTIINPQEVVEERNRIITKSQAPSTLPPIMIPTVIDNSVTSVERDDYYDFFHFKDEEDKLEAIKSATSVMEESRTSQTFFEKLLNSLNIIGSPF